MPKKSYLFFKAKNPITGCASGSFCTAAQCSKPLTECPLYQALEKEPLLESYYTTSMTPGITEVTVCFPECYGDVLIKKEYKRFQEIATQCMQENPR